MRILLFLVCFLFLSAVAFAVNLKDILTLQFLAPKYDTEEDYKWQAKIPNMESEHEAEKRAIVERATKERERIREDFIESTSTELNEQRERSLIFEMWLPKLELFRNLTEAAEQELRKEVTCDSHNNDALADIQACISALRSHIARLHLFRSNISLFKRELSSLTKLPNGDTDTRTQMLDTLDNMAEAIARKAALLVRSGDHLLEETLKIEKEKAQQNIDRIFRVEENRAYCENLKDLIEPKLRNILLNMNLSFEQGDLVSFREHLQSFRKQDLEWKSAINLCQIDNRNTPAELENFRKKAKLLEAIPVSLWFEKSCDYLRNAHNVNHAEFLEACENLSVSEFFFASYRIALRSGFTK